MLQTLCTLLPKTTFLKSSVLLILIISFILPLHPGPRRLINLCGSIGGDATEARTRVPPQILGPGGTLWSLLRFWPPLLS